MGACKDKPESLDLRKRKDYIPFSVGGHLGAGTVHARLKVFNCKKVYCPLHYAVEQISVGKLEQGAVM